MSAPSSGCESRSPCTGPACEDATVSRSLATLAAYTGALSALLTACTSATLPAEIEPPAPRATSTPAPLPDVEGIVAFDCTQAGGDIEGQALRDFRGGGPHGSVWNWERDLSCAVTLRTACTGALTAELAVGRATPLRASAAAEAGASHTVMFAVPHGVWESELEPASDPYSTLTFVVRVDGACRATDESAAYPFHWVDGFVGGFSAGE
jgi:hypothetical protein